MPVIFVAGPGPGRVPLQHDWVPIPRVGQRVTNGTVTSSTSTGLTSRRNSTKIHNLPQHTARRRRLRSMFAELTRK